MSKEDKELILTDLCVRLPYDIMCQIDKQGKIYKLKGIYKHNGIWWYEFDGFRIIIPPKPYLRPMSSMTEEEKEDLLITLLGKNDTKYFQVLPDGSIDNNDTAHQDLSNFNIHWINFDGVNTSTYIDWCNKNHFDYRGLIEKGLAIEVTENNNPYENL